MQTINWYEQKQGPLLENKIKFGKISFCHHFCHVQELPKLFLLTKYEVQLSISTSTLHPKNREKWYYTYILLHYI